MSSSNAADALRVDPQQQRFNDLAAQVIALAANRDSATRTDYAHPRFREIVQLLQDVQAGEKK
ncbi:MAG: hypothetical protein AB7O43_11450 [Hyphomicrobiaceae bacterium]